MNYWDRTDTWTTRDGDVIPLEKLTASHRANIIAMLYRQASHIREHMSNQIMVLSLSLTGEMAMDMAALEQQRVDGALDEDLIEDLPLVRRLREIDRAQFAPKLIPTQPNDPVDQLGAIVATLTYGEGVGAYDRHYCTEQLRQALGAGGLAVVPTGEVPPDLLQEDLPEHGHYRVSYEAEHDPGTYRSEVLGTLTEAREYRNAMSAQAWARVWVEHAHWVEVDL